MDARTREFLASLPGAAAERARKAARSAERVEPTVETLRAGSRSKALRVAKGLTRDELALQIAGNAKRLDQFGRGELDLDGPTSRKLLAYFGLENWDESPGEG